MTNKGNERKEVREKRIGVLREAAEKEQHINSWLLQEVQECSREIKRRRQADDILLRMLVRSFGTKDDQDELNALFAAEQQ